MATQPALPGWPPSHLPGWLRDPGIALRHHGASFETDTAAREYRALNQGYLYEEKGSTFYLELGPITKGNGTMWSIDRIDKEVA